MKKLSTDPATLVLVACAVLVTALVVRRELVPRSDGIVTRRMAPEWKQLSQSGHRSGASNGPVHIVEFSDFQCPYCADAQRVLARVLARHSEEVTLIYRHFPLRGIHPFAVEAAQAAECAGDQGRFDVYHDLLFTLGDSLGKTPWEEVARRARVVSLGEFSSCLRSGERLSRVEEDEQVAHNLGLEGTPTLVINGEIMEGAVSLQNVEEAIDRATRR
ncbi:MAG: DsbA family protein [Gemmatimonadales bacterium]